MASMKKFSIIGVFISILSIIAMSHNVSAIQPVINLNNYDLVYQAYALELSCEFVNMMNTSTTGHNYCFGQIGQTGSTQRLSGITYIYSTDTFDTKKNDILTFYLLVTMDDGATESDLRLQTMTNQNLGWNVLDWKVADSGKIQDKLLSYNGIINQQGLNYDLSVDFFEGYQYFKLYEISLISRNDGKKHLGLTSTTGNSILEIFMDDAFGSKFRFKLSDFKQYRFAGDEANKEVEQKTQEAVDDSQNAGSSSSSNAQQGGANLLSAITGFFGVITSASPTNCVFNAPLNTYFGNQRLNVDLCALDLPSEIGALTSIIAIGILIPFAIHMFNKFIALFRSFQS